MGSSCTAMMQAKMSEDGRVSVTVHPLHYGQATGMADLPHPRLPKATKAFAHGTSYGLLLAQTAAHCEGWPILVIYSDWICVEVITLQGWWDCRSIRPMAAKAVGLRPFY